MPERRHPLSEYSFFNYKEQKQLERYDATMLVIGINQMPEKAMYVYHELFRTRRFDLIYQAAMEMKSMDMDPDDFLTEEALKSTAIELKKTGERAESIADFIDTVVFESYRGFRRMHPKQHIAEADYNKLCGFADKIITSACGSQ